MTRRQVWNNLKTFTLLILVIASLVLSYQLWAGYWQGTNSALGTEVLPTPATSTPTDEEVDTPSRMLVHDQGRDRTSLLLPGTPLFDHGLQLLQQAKVDSFRELGGNAYDNSITLDFGYSLTHAVLIHLIPSLKTFNVGVTGNKIVLNDDPWTGTVSLVIPGYGGAAWYTTNITQSAFTDVLNRAARGEGWTQPPGTTSYVPKNSIVMKESTWAVKQTVQMTLIRSFFVNPLALTSLAEAGNSYVWTDGSRIVWWNQPKGEMTYQDPNVTSTTLSNLPSLDVAVNFVRAHGGSPTNAIASTPGYLAGPNAITDFRMRPYIDGYPVVDGSADYQVQFMMGQITQYVRPIWELNQEISSKPVRVMGYSQLTDAMNRLSPDFSWDQLNVELGYATVTRKNGDITFEPVYIITSDGLTLWTLSAVTGQPLKGGRAS